MILELQEPEVTQHGMEASWSERQDHVRKLKELHGRREGLSAAVRSSSLSTSSRYNVHLACVVLERISEVLTDPRYLLLPVFPAAQPRRCRGPS